MPYLEPRDEKRQRQEANRAAWAERANATPLPPEEAAPQDIDTPDGMRRLFRAALEGVWRIVRAPLSDRTVTNQDRLNAFSHLRLALGVGKEPPPPDLFRVPMESLLGSPPDGVSPPAHGATSPDEPGGGDATDSASGR